MCLRFPSLVRCWRDRNDNFTFLLRPFDGCLPIALRDGVGRLSERAERYQKYARREDDNSVAEENLHQDIHPFSLSPPTSSPRAIASAMASSSAFHKPSA